MFNPPQLLGNESIFAQKPKKRRKTKKNEEKRRKTKKNEGKTKEKRRKTEKNGEKRRKTKKNGKIADLNCPREKRNFARDKECR